MPTNTWRHRALLSLSLLCGCAQNDLAPLPPGEMRITVWVRSEWMGQGEATTTSNRLAQVPVKDVVEVGTGRFRMILVCGDDAACNAAVARIRADPGFAVGVDVEKRQKVPAQPSRDASR